MRHNAHSDCGELQYVKSSIFLRISQAWWVLSRRWQHFISVRTIARIPSGSRIVNELGVIHDQERVDGWFIFPTLKAGAHSF